MKTSELKTCVLFLKYVPIISAFIMLLYVSSLVFDKVDNSDRNIVTKTFTMSTTPTVGTMILSKSLGFCSLHRCLIGYTYGVTFCIAHQAITGFGALLIPMRIFMLVIGIILFLWLGIHIYTHKINIFMKK